MLKLKLKIKKEEPKKLKLKIKMNGEFAYFDKWLSQLSMCKYLIDCPFNSDTTLNMVLSNKKLISESIKDYQFESFINMYYSNSEDRLRNRLGEEALDKANKVAELMYYVLSKLSIDGMNFVNEALFNKLRVGILIKKGSLPKYIEDLSQGTDFVLKDGIVLKSSNYINRSKHYKGSLIFIAIGPHQHISIHYSMYKRLLKLKNVDIKLRIMEIPDDGSIEYVIFDDFVAIDDGNVKQLIYNLVRLNCIKKSMSNVYDFERGNNMFSRCEMFDNRDEVCYEDELGHKHNPKFDEFMYEFLPGISMDFML